jgi:PIN domain nuclease of toxin-antitoxin system
VVRRGSEPGVPEAAVTDTHPLLFHAADSRRLGRQAAAMFAAAERQSAIIYVPTAVIWECAVLAWSGRIDLHRPLARFFADLFSNPAYQPVDLTPGQVYRADEARPNRDPFDALICATARHLELALLTRDDAIRQSGLVRVLW